MGALLDIAIAAVTEKPSDTSSTVGPPGTKPMPADPVPGAVEARRRRVEERLRERSEDRVAFDVADAPLKPGPGEPVSVVLAVRTAAGIVSGELRVPRDRFDAALFERALTETASLPS